MKKKKIFITGHKGLLGSAFVKNIKDEEDYEIITASRSLLDLRDQKGVNNFFQKNRPDEVILSAAKVGGILANLEKPSEFMYDNLMIQSNIIHFAAENGIKNIIFIGSSCIYPRECKQPIKENYLLGDFLEPTNEAYAISKIAGLKMTKYYSQKYGFRCVCPMLCNLYGDNDNFELKNAHVLSALVRKFVDAVDSKKDKITLWGSGDVKREFMYVDDAVRAIMILLKQKESFEQINVGFGIDISIKDLAKKIAFHTNFKGEINWDKSKPDGTPRKLMDNSLINKLGFKPRIDLDEGIKKMINFYTKNKDQIIKTP